MKRFALRGFTLIELLIVVAIIAILAAIALPNFMESQVRSKVARAKNDMRTIATALEAYSVDHNSYPLDGAGPPYIGYIGLTTPVAYITEVFEDPFNYGRVDGRSGLRYGRERMDCRFELGCGNGDGFDVAWPNRVWALASYGPDRNDDTYVISAYPFTNDACPYDVTNGTVSNGDIYRLGPDTNHPNFQSDANPMHFPGAPE